MFRRFLFGCLLVGALGNATLSLAEVYPQAADKALIKDDLVGSGFEIRDGRPARHAVKRLGNRRPNSVADNAIRAIRAARGELQRRDPHLGAALASRLARIQSIDCERQALRSSKRGST